MGYKNNLSLLELQFFKDEVFRLSQELKVVTDKMEIENTSKSQECFNKVGDVFLELRELAQDLGASGFENYFNGFYEVLLLANQADNIRATKKVCLMCLDYQEVLEGLSKNMHDKDRIKGCLKALEVLTFKQDRLKRGEFYSLTQGEFSSPKKQRTA